MNTNVRTEAERDGDLETCLNDTRRLIAAAFSLLGDALEGNPRETRNFNVEEFDVVYTVLEKAKEEMGKTMMAFSDR
ncbi:hypothetical protein ACFFP0_25325 [Rhizobium puerariae]|uniref:Uncharacterized protein n=1 Tax=Rhizobium puerariae TaxID=1585791 RepID=A0ABV6APZ6_9HYPH